MAFIKKLWTDRNTEHPSRRLLTPVAGEANTYDVTRAEGTVIDPGDPFNADNMNDLENRVKDGMDIMATELATNLDNKTLRVLTKSQFDAISSKDSTVIYFVEE